MAIHHFFCSRFWLVKLAPLWSRPCAVVWFLSPMSHVPLFQTPCLHSRHLVSSSFLLAPNLYCLTHVPRNSKSFSEPLKDKSVQIHAACSVLHPAILQNLHELLRRTNRTMQTSTDFWQRITVWRGRLGVGPKLSAGEVSGGVVFGTLSKHFCNAENLDATFCASKSGVCVAGGRCNRFSCWLQEWNLMELVIAWQCRFPLMASKVRLRVSVGAL